MKIEMKLLSDAIFGNGVSVPGAEDISVLVDQYGFPYYKGGTFKGLFREEVTNYLIFCGKDEETATKEVDALFGKHGDKEDRERKLNFTDLTLSDQVKEAVLEETSTHDPTQVTEVFTHLRTFTKIDENGMVQDGSLRQARCVNKGLYFYGEVACCKEDEEMLKDALGFVKWLGTMRNRGFGQVQIKAVEV